MIIKKINQSVIILKIKKKLRMQIIKKRSKLNMEKTILQNNWSNLFIIKN